MKISEALKGKPKSEEARKKMSNWQVGRTIPYGTKEKISQSTRGSKNHNFGKHISEEQKRAISIAHNGKHLSEETKRKKSEAMKAYWANKKMGV